MGAVCSGKHGDCPGGEAQAHEHDQESGRHRAEAGEYANRLVAVVGRGLQAGFDTLSQSHEKETHEGEGCGHTEAVGEDQEHTEGGSAQGDCAEKDDEGRVGGASGRDVRRFECSDADVCRLRCTEPGELFLNTVGMGCMAVVAGLVTFVTVMDVVAVMVVAVAFAVVVVTVMGVYYAARR